MLPPTHEPDTQARRRVAAARVSAGIDRKGEFEDTHRQIPCCVAAARRANEWWVSALGGAPIVIMPHGNYKGAYPPPEPRETVARRYGLDPSRPIGGCIGALRNYKGVDLALDAVALLGGRVQLICAGAPHPEFPIDALLKAESDNEFVVAVPCKLPDQEFSNICAACDIILLPYRTITGSGALQAALTMGIGVITSDLPCFREILPPRSAAGRILDNLCATSLANTIEDYLLTPPDERRLAALAISAHFDWQQVVKPVLEELTRIRSRHMN